MGSAFFVVLMGSASGCTDRLASETYDWPAPQDISQYRLERKCVIVDDGLKCWGYENAETDEDFMLLLGREDPVPPPPIPDFDFGTDAEVLAVDSAFGTPSRCAVLAGEGVKCWGENRFFSLGVPEETYVPT